MSKTIVTLLGDASHDHDVLLANIRGAVSGKMPGCDVADAQPETLVSLLDRNPALLILSKMNPHKSPDGSQADWMDASRESRIVAYVEGGGSLFVWHSGLATFPPEGKYIQMLGGRFFHRPPEFLKVTYSPVAGTPMAPVSPAFEAMDEHYQVTCDPEKATIFLNSSSAEGVSPAGWYRIFGRGRICCLAAPHPSATGRIPKLEEILQLCLEWCTGNGGNA
jgi:type 1 glutamine amidotransferase